MGVPTGKPESGQETGGLVLLLMFLLPQSKQAARFAVDPFNI